MERRTFLSRSAMAVGGLGFAGQVMASEKEPLFKLSLAEWSLHRTLFGDAQQKLGWSKFVKGLKTNSQATMTGKITNLDFPVIARQTFGIEAVEYVNQFFLDKAHDEKYLGELNKRAKNEGVTNVLIMCDHEGRLGAKDKTERHQAVKDHSKWIDAAAFLGCHSIRVNAHGDGSPDEQKKQVTESLLMLVEIGDKQDINVIVENHGGLSSDAEWLLGVMKSANHPRVGTLPDFGNFPDDADIYKSVEMLMPYAKGVSAKSGKFDEEGNEARIDYFKMMKIVLDAGYHGYVGIESGGGAKDEYEGIRKTKALLERVRKTFS